MKKILVIEDEDNIRSFVVINLKRAGYDVLEAASGEEAFEVLERNRDVVLMVVDLMLPGIDGYEICRRIRARGSDMGIIMLTARSQEMDKVTGLMTGADDYITKPFSPYRCAHAPARRQYHALGGNCQWSFRPEPEKPYAFEKRFPDRIDTG